MLKTAQEVISSGDASTIVDFAIEVNRIVTRSSKELEVVKAHIRKLAASQPASSMGVEIDGNLGVATVTFHKDSVSPRKGKDLRDVEVNLPKAVFSRLFSKVVVVQPLENYQDLLGTLSEEEREIVDRFVEVLPSTPKVHLTK